MSRSRHKHISVDLHADLADRALSLADECERAEELCEALRQEQTSRPHAARVRAARAIVRRLYGRVRGGLESRPVHALLRYLDPVARRHALLHLTAEREPLLTAVAAEVLHPYFVLQGYPGAMSAEEFRAVNTGQLFTEDRLITHAFLQRFAAQRWRLRRPASTRAALRIMRDAAVLDAAWIPGSRRRRLGYFESAHGLDWPVFAYALYRELEREGAGGRWAVDRLLNADFVKLFLTPRVRVQALVGECQRRGLVRRQQPVRGHLELALPSTDAAVAHILGEGSASDLA